MSTAPLDLTALRRDMESAAKCQPGAEAHPWEYVDPDDLVEVIARAEAAEAAMARVRELATAWAQRGEHTMKYAATCPEDVRETLHENGADMLDSARKVITALDDNS